MDANASWHSFLERVPWATRHCYMIVTIGPGAPNNPSTQMTPRASNGPNVSHMDVSDDYWWYECFACGIPLPFCHHCTHEHYQNPVPSDMRTFPCVFRHDLRKTKSAIHLWVPCLSAILIQIPFKFAPWSTGPYRFRFSFFCCHNIVLHLYMLLVQIKQRVESWFDCDI